MLERVIVDGIPVYKDKHSNAAYIYDSEQIPLGKIADGRLVLDAGWRDATAARLDEWRKALEVRSRAGK